jgi:VWFA-related protein
MKIRYGGATALYDALAVACKERMGPREWRKPSRRVLILITDGEDNQSHATRGEAVSEALKAGTVVFTINTINAASSVGGKGEKTLEYFASLTGGESFSGPEPRALTRIRDLIDGMYFLSYVPTGGAQTGMHEIEVKPAPKNKFEISYAREYLWNP